LQASPAKAPVEMAAIERRVRMVFIGLDQLICLEHRSPLKWKVQAAEPQAKGQDLGCYATATMRRMGAAAGLETLLTRAM
jgi:hypothetical protein